METINTKIIYDLDISIERLKGLQETLEALLEDNEDIKINAIVKSLEREINEASDLVNNLERDIMNKE